VPLYDYECEAGHRYEIRLPFGTPAQQPCEQCGKPARRLLNVPPIVFKGSGWYVTDSQRSLRTGVGTERGGDAVESDGAHDASGTETAAEAAPTAGKKAATSSNGKSAKTTKAKTAASDD